MAITAHITESGVPGDSTAMDIDLESGHKVITGLMAALQRHFKDDTRYARPLMSPQANIVFALDADAAKCMMLYMAAKLKESCGFAEDEFRFICKAGSNGDILHRVRLEFTSGVTAHIIRRMLIATDRLERVLPTPGA